MDSLELVGSILPFEVWFIDEGSKEDYIVSYVEEQANPHFHALRQPNMGCGGARNTGIEHSTGRYVTFVDSDDFIYYGPYIEILKVLKETQPDILAFTPVPVPTLSDALCWTSCASPRTSSTKTKNSAHACISWMPASSH